MPRQELFNMTKELDALFVRTYEEYVLAHRELEDFHKGILDPNNEEKKAVRLEELNSILMNIQDKWSEVLPVFNYIASRYEFGSNAVKSYNDFIANLEAEIEKQRERSEAQS